jgi:hypothetical protein
LVSVIGNEMEIRHPAEIGKSFPAAGRAHKSNFWQRVISVMREIQTSHKTSRLLPGKLHLQLGVSPLTTVASTALGASP